MHRVSKNRKSFKERRDKLLQSERNRCASIVEQAALSGDIGTVTFDKLRALLERIRSGK